MKKFRLLLATGLLVCGLAITPCVVRADDAGTGSSEEGSGGSDAGGDQGSSGSGDQGGSGGGDRGGSGTGSGDQGGSGSGTQTPPTPPKNYIEDGTEDKVFSSESAAENYYVNTNTINFTYMAKDGTFKQETMTIDHAMDINIAGAFWQGDVTKVIVSNIGGVISATYMMDFASFNPIKPIQSASSSSSGTVASSGSSGSSGGGFSPYMAFAFAPQAMPSFDFGNMFGSMNAVQTPTFDFNNMFGGMNTVQTPAFDFNNMFGGQNAMQFPTLDFGNMFGGQSAMQFPSFDFGSLFGGQGEMNFGFDFSNMFQQPGMEGFGQFEMEGLFTEEMMQDILNGANEQ